MSARPQQPEPFLRGCVYPGLSDTTYPRANPADAEHLPRDVWQSAQVPAGIRLELVGEADAVRIFYKTTTGNLGYRGEGAGCTFSMYRSGQKLAEQEAVLGDGVVQLPLFGEPSRPAIVYLPEGMRPTIMGVEGIGGVIEPAPRQPRWLCYGDAVTQGWLASAPSLAWPAVTARKLGLDLFNLGYAGSARTDTAAAQALADIPAEIVSVALGANSWGRFPHTPALCIEEVRALLTLLRAGHPDARIVIMSPLLRPDAEDTPNGLGATLTELRIAMEEAVRERMIAGDIRLHLVEGSTVVSASDLADGRYPGDDGHIRIAAAVGKVISPLVGELRAVADANWAAEIAAALQLESPAPQLPSTDFLRQVGTAIGPVGSPRAVLPQPQPQEAEYHGPIPSVGVVPQYGRPGVPLPPVPAPAEAYAQANPGSAANPPAQVYAQGNPPAQNHAQSPAPSQAYAQATRGQAPQVQAAQMQAAQIEAAQMQAAQMQAAQMQAAQMQAARAQVPHPPDSSEREYDLTDGPKGDDSNWDEELSGARMAAQLAARMADQLAAEMADGSPDAASGDAEVANIWSDARYGSVQ